jgi:hypothetical protein
LILTLDAVNFELGIYLMLAFSSGLNPSAPTSIDDRNFMPELYLGFYLAAVSGL